MIPKILVFKNGERVIAGAGERKGEDGRGVCLVIKCPYILTLGPKEGENDNFTVNFSKWNPFSTTIEYNIPYDAVITISDPDQGILDAYLEKFSAELYYEEKSNESEIDLTEE